MTLDGNLFEPSILKLETLAAPDDGVAGEAEGPDANGDQIAKWQEPEIEENLVIGEDLDADCHGEREAQKETQGQEPEAKGAEAAGYDVEQRPGKAVGED